MPSRILIADDEPNIREVIGFALERAGMSTMAVRNGAETLVEVRRGKFDLIVLDIGMPEMDGLEVCRQVRKFSEVPILFLSARDEEIDRVLGLEIGGDDYVTKPFSPRELVARVNAILKRTLGSVSSRGRALRHGALSLDPTGHAASFEDRGIDLTGREFAILEALAARPEMVFGRQALVDAAYGPAMHVADRTIDSHIRNIRAKFAEAGCSDIIATVHGVGFKLGLSAVATA